MEKRQVHKMFKRPKTDESLLIIDNNNKIRMIRSKLSKDKLQQIIQRVPLNRKTLLVCLIAGLISGAMLGIFR